MGDVHRPILGPARQSRRRLPARGSAEPTRGAASRTATQARRQHAIPSRGHARLARARAPRSLLTIASPPAPLPLYLPLKAAAELTRLFDEEERALLQPRQQPGGSQRVSQDQRTPAHAQT